MPHESALDVSGTLARLGGDQQLFRELLEFALADTPALMNKLRRAIELPDGVVVRSTAHALTGLLSGCGGSHAAEAARQIEKAAERGDLSDLARLLSDLDCKVERLTHAALGHRDRLA